MAGRSLNFQKQNKKFLTITFYDGEKILVKGPKKRVMDNIVNLSNSLDEANENKADMETIDELYRACTDIMNNNMENKILTQEYIEDQLDFEDLTECFNQFMEFITDFTQTIKN